MSREQPIYLDYAATTPLDARVAAAMQPWLLPAPGAAHAAAFGNAAAPHAYGRRAQAAVEQARAQVAALLGCAARDIVFTSGATEANNLALLGLMRGRHARGRHVVSSRIEHKSVLDPLQALRQEGVALTLVEPDSDGSVPPAAVAAALRADTALVALMHVNNETGVVQDIAAVGALCRERGIPLHVDAAQSAGKRPLDLARLPVDLLSISAHKLCGPQGVGALYVRPELRASLAPLVHGGGQERGLRSGTLPVHQIVGMGAACAIAAQELAVEAARVAALRDSLQAGLLRLPGVLLNGAAAQRVAGILNVSFPDLNGECLLHDLAELALTTSAACNSDSDEPSYVLRALGRDAVTAEASLRFSLGRFSTAAEVATAVAAVTAAVQQQRARLPEPHGGATGSPEARVRFELRLDAAGVIAGAAYRAWGCHHTHRVCAWLCAQLPGRAPAAAACGGPREWLRLLEVPTERLGRLLVVEEALQQALRDAKTPVQAKT